MTKHIVRSATLPDAEAVRVRVCQLYGWVRPTCHVLTSVFEFNDNHVLLLALNHSTVLSCSSCAYHDKSKGLTLLASVHSKPGTQLKVKNSNASVETMVGHLDRTAIVHVRERLWWSPERTFLLRRATLSYHMCSVETRCRVRWISSSW